MINLPNKPTKTSSATEYLLAQAQRHQLSRHEQDIASLDSRQDRQMTWILALATSQIVSFAVIVLLLNIYVFS